MAENKPTNSVAELAKKTGKSREAIYKIARQLGRLPTEEEVKNWRKPGRPPKYV